MTWSKSDLDKSDFQNFGISRTTCWIRLKSRTSYIEYGAEGPVATCGNIFLYQTQKSMLGFSRLGFKFELSTLQTWFFFWHWHEKKSQKTYVPTSKVKVFIKIDKVTYPKSQYCKSQHCKSQHKKLWTSILEKR